MTKIVYNACFGGFGLSKTAVELYAKYSGISLEEEWRHEEIKRTDPVLVRVVEELGEAASGSYADLVIRELPAGTRYRIDAYDGSESVITIDEYEWSVA